MKLIRKVINLFNTAFPRLRAPFRGTDLLPLLLFLLAYAALILGMVYGDVVLFARPAAFGLMAVSIWIWWMNLNGYSGLNRTRGNIALITRLALAGLFVALVAEPRSVRTNDTLSVVFALDISDSIGRDSVSQAAEFVAGTVVGKPPGDEIGLIVFGSNAAVELPPRESFPLEGGTLVLNSRIDGDATNIEQALALSGALLPQQTCSRIILVSDGTETAGNLDSVINDLIAREITVDVLPISYSYDREVWVERLELPQFVKIGENYEASIVLSSLQAGDGQLVLEENGQECAEIDIEFQAGKNRYDIPIYLREPGYYEYRAIVRTGEEQDNLEENNEAIGYIYVEGEGKALLVIDPLGDPQDHEELQRAIIEGERAVEVLDAYDFPRDPLSLMPYDCVVFVNAPHDAFDSVQLQALHDAVYNQGLGFLMVGGENSFGPGGYHNTVVEDVLPVSMDITKKKILPKGALVIILHTCEFPEGNTWGKRITQQAIAVLGEQDEVGVLAYGAGGEDWLFELTPAGELDELIPVINGASIGDMPSFGPTMQQGFDALKDSDAATRHMIIISDGDPQPPPPALLQQYINEQISVSTISIFPHGGTEIALLRQLAASTGGRYYFPSDPNELPSIFIKEAKTLKRSMIQNQEIFPNLGFPSQVMEGIAAIPSLQGYVLTSLKEEGPVEEVLFTVSPDAEEGETDPVLAVWRYGLGVTAAFTSDLSPNWGANWVNWEQYQAFVKQLLIQVSRVRSDSHLKMWSYTSGSEGVVMVEDFHPDEMFLDVVAQVAGPGEQTESLHLRQIGPRRYQATFPLWGKGRYQVMSLGQSGEREDRAHGGFIVSYSPEYTNFRSNWNILREIQERTGGEMLEPTSTPESIFNRREPKQSSQPIFDWLIIALACLVPLDVAVRRVQLDWYVIKGWLGFDKRAGSTQTMGALLARKKDVSSQLKRREERPLQTLASSVSYDREMQAARRTAPVKPKTTQSASPAATAHGESTTTSRLLELKRRRQSDPADEE